MEMRNTYVLQGTAGFARGELDNVAVADDAVTLERVGGQYILYGCYTSQIVAMPAFHQIMVSWNADTPEGTVVEAQVRVLQDGVWSAWAGFGKWCPYLRRSGINQPDGVQADTLTITGSPATQMQLRVYLYTDDERITPAVWLLAASVRPDTWPQQPGRPIGRTIYAPAYSQINRDPAFGDSMDLPVAVASLMNRSGADILPDALAHMMYDETLHGCGNRAFAAAAAGCCGYEAYTAFMDPAALRQEVRSGFPVGITLNCAHTEEEAKLSGLPYLRGVKGTGRRMVVLRGFLPATPEMGEGVLLNDPLAQTDTGAECQVLLKDLLTCWDNTALAVHRRRKNGGSARPSQMGGKLIPLGPIGEYHMEQQGEECVLPAIQAEEGGRPICTFAYTVQEETVYATTAHKAFHYLTPGPDGLLCLPPEIFGEGSRITVYAIDWQGNMVVSELKPERREFN